jgi:hypothetical protein
MVQWDYLLCPSASEDKEDDQSEEQGDAEGHEVVVCDLGYICGKLGRDERRNGSSSSVQGVAAR